MKGKTEHSEFFSGLGHSKTHSFLSVYYSENSNEV